MIEIEEKKQNNSKNKTYHKCKKIAVVSSVLLIAIGLILCFTVFTIRGFDINMLDTENYETKTVEISEKFNNIDIKNISSDVQIEKSTDKKCRIIYKKEKNVEYKIDVKNDTLNITVTDKSKWYENIHIGFSTFKFSEITLYLPEQNYKKLKLKSTNGDIKIDSELTFKDTDLESTSGDISIDGSVFGKTQLNTTSGDVDISNSEFESISVSCTSGEIEISDIVSKNSSNFNSISGDIELTNSKSGSIEIYTTSGDINLFESLSYGNTNMETISGEIKLKNADIKDTVIQTTSGDVSGTVKGNKNFVTNTVSGDIKISNSYSDGDMFNVSTVSGDIDISISNK